MIYILGANGFLGRKLCNYFAFNQVPYVPVWRTPPNDTKNGLHLVDFVKNLAEKKYSTEDTIVNCIGTAHLNYKIQKKMPEIYNEANIDLCVEIAELAIQSNIGRFVHISSISVLGNNLKSKVQLKTDPSPRDPYGLSKHVAEMKLKELYFNRSESLIILRPSLVYGVNARGNFSKLCKVINLSFPLPLAGLKNRKSFLSDMNFASFVHLVCTEHFESPITFNISDVEQNNMIDFIRLIAKAQKKNLVVFNLPLKIVKVIFHIFRKQEYFEKLSEDFVIDMSEVIKVTGWIPAETQEEAIKRIMENYNGV